MTGSPDDARATLLAEKPDPAVDLEDIALEDDYALSPRYVAMVVDAADRGDTARLRELAHALHPADVADLMGFLSAEHREALLPALDPEDFAEVLSELDENIRDELLEQMAPAQLAQAINELESDDAVDLMEDLEAGQRDAVLAAMSDADRAAIVSALAYQDETAGRLMQREVLAAPEFWTVGQVIAHIRAADDAPELFFEVYVVDPGYKPVGAVAVSRLLMAQRDQALTAIMEPIVEIPVDLDQEEAAYIFDKYHLVSAPVIDDGGRLVGQITVDDIVEVIQEESQEDILALAGVTDAGRDADLWEIVRSRLPWLMVNTATAALAVSVIGLFQAEIAKLVTLAILMPIVASLGGNAGTQSLAVSVRALATRELSAANARRIFGRELIVGLFNGLVIAAVLGIGAYAIFHDLLLSVTMMLAIVINLVVAAMAGVMAPVALERLGRDPAVSSPVFVTFVTDFVGFFAFLGLAAVILL